MISKNEVFIKFLEFYLFFMMCCFCVRSAFFFFCNEFRASVKEANPSFGIGDVSKELAKRWEACKNRSKYDEQAKKDKARYEKVKCD